MKGSRRFTVKRTALVVSLICSLGTWPARTQDREMRTIAGNFADTLAKVGKKNVAVVDFTDLQGNVTELGRYLAEQMSVALALTNKGIEVIDRTHLKAIVQENKLSASGLIDPATARKLGQLIGVEVLVTGTLTPLGDSVQLALKALDASTARIIEASTTEVPRTKAIEDLLSRDISTPSDGNAGASRTNTASTVSGRGVPPKEMDDITFTVNSCRFTGSSVICSLQFTNRGRDREMRLGGQFGGTRILDQAGREHIVSVLQLGGRDCRGCAVVNKLVSEVPLAAALAFENVADISRISLLEVNYSMDGGGRWSTVQFRDVPVSTSPTRR
jgi:TolB-like protein